VEDQRRKSHIRKVRIALRIKQVTMGKWKLTFPFFM
jgi:hypothetical protein